MADTITTDIARIKAQTKGAYNKMVTMAVALCMQYAAMVLQSHRQRQSRGDFWNNQTYTAMNTVFSDKIHTQQVIGWFLSHLVDYGVYLELANNRRKASILPTVMKFYARFNTDLEKIFQGKA